MSDFSRFFKKSKEIRKIRPDFCNVFFLLWSVLLNICVVVNHACLREELYLFVLCVWLLNFLCAGIKCPFIPTPVNGTKSSEEVFVDSLVVLRCERGYEPMNNTTLLCEENGQWNGTAKDCSGTRWRRKKKRRYQAVCWVTFSLRYLVFGYEKENSNKINKLSCDRH